MARKIYVGEGLFKKTLADALKMAKPNDCLVLDAGTYEVGQGIEIADVYLQGNGRQPGDVVLTGRIFITGEVRLENLTIFNDKSLSKAGDNSCLLVKSGSLKAIGCLFNGGEGGYVATCISGGTTWFKNCTFTAEGSSITGVKVMGPAEVAFRGCRIDGVWALERAVLKIETSQVDGHITVEDQSKLTGTDLYLGSDLGQREIVVKSGSQMVVDSLTFAEGRTNLRANRGLIQATTSNIDLMHSAFYSADEQSTVDIPGVEIKAGK